MCDPHEIKQTFPIIIIKIFFFRYLVGEKGCKCCTDDTDVGGAIFPGGDCSGGNTCPMGDRRGVPPCPGGECIAGDPCIG